MGILTTEEHALMVSQVVKNVVADERARIVAMLRLAAENDPNARCSILDLADEIESGE